MSVSTLPTMSIVILGLVSASLVALRSVTMS